MKLIVSILVFSLLGFAMAIFGLINVNNYEWCQAYSDCKITYHFRDGTCLMNYEGNAEIASACHQWNPSDCWSREDLVCYQNAITCPKPYCVSWKAQFLAMIGMLVVFLSIILLVEDYSRISS